MMASSAIRNVWTLAVYIGNESSAPIRIKVERVALIGRQDPADGCYPELDLNPFGARDAGVSRRHAQFAIVNGRLYLTDLDSVNGTRLNGVKIPPHEPQMIRDGDQLECGKLRMIVYILAEG
ncbi:MAG: FHA domain-containing protein [Anaerolinea sp.]|nr:FHA domain-containing protein [Anaerolinea sp.]MCC6975273.1 FHA domain-containing protein [Anaerolineae bacterium]CAG1004772.1 Oxoglutarate dehydrogenase inhibitor [Anaerolineae bacterium]